MRGVAQSVHQRSQSRRHERAKLRLLHFEKTGAFVTVFMIFEAPVLLCCQSFLMKASIRTAHI
jgi:hypothetical protein